MYAVRKTVWNRQKKTQGRVNNRLCDIGIEQSSEAAINLKNICFDYIFCSPLLRAVQTANIINKYHNLKIIRDERLTDIDQGYFTGKYFNKLTQEELKIKKRRDKNYGMENLKEAFKRVKNFYNYLIKNYSNKTILIVTHSGVAKFIEYILNNNKFIKKEFNKLIPYCNCEIRVFTNL